MWPKDHDSTSGTIPGGWHRFDEIDLDWWEATGNVNEAVSELTLQVDAATKALGWNDPQTMADRHDLAIYLGLAGRVDEMAAVFSRLISDQALVLGIESVDRIAALQSFAGLLLRADRYEAALDRFRELAKILERVLGADDWGPMSIRLQIGHCLDGAGRLGESAAVYESVLADATRCLGPADELTLTTRSLLADVLGRTGWRPEAIHHLRSLIADTPVGFDDYEMILKAIHDRVAALIADNDEPEL